MAQVNSREQTDKLRMNKELREYMKELREAIRRDEDSREVWEQKILVATNQRLGVKRQTNRPYPGAPDIPVPETDKIIRKRKPDFVLSAAGQKKAADVDVMGGSEGLPPEVRQKIKRAERGFNYVILKRMDWLKTLSIAVDEFQEKGHTIFEIIEEFKFESVQKTIELSDFGDDQIKAFKALPTADKRLFIADRFDLDDEDEQESVEVSSILEQFNAGEEAITYNKVMISSMPRVIIPEAENIIVPHYTTDIEQAERVTKNFYLSRRQLDERALSGAYNKTNVKKALKGMVETIDPEKDDDIRRRKNINEGLTEKVGPSELYRMQSVRCWRPTGPNGYYERWVFVFFADVADDKDALVQMIRFPFEFDSWNLVKHDNELKDNRYYSSRGVPEQIQAMQQFIERALNNMLIRDEINNAPVYTVKSSSKIRPGTLRFIPGQRIPVNNHDEIAELGNRQNKVDLSSNLIMQILKAMTEEYIGSTDQLFRNATNKGGGKTLGEIERGMQQAQNLQSLDLLLWNESLKRVYLKVWSILRNRLGEPIVVNGESISKEDFDFDPEITPTGSLEVLNKFEQLQRAMQRVQMIMQMIQLGLIANAEDLYNVVQDYLEKDGVKDPDRFITRPEIIAQEKAQLAAQQEQVLAQKEAELAGEIDKLKAQGVQEGAGDAA